jgi:hemerythrin
MFEWESKYELGVDFIDEQHKKLFEIGNRAYNLFKNEFCIDKYDKIVQIIEELKDYTVFHFTAEEGYLKKMGYKKLLSHKVEHDDFVNKFNNIDLKKIDEKQDDYIVEILEFIYKWIDEHILVKDREYKNELSNLK